VIIPAYNAEGFLERAVRSALGQTEQDLEVIVVDDGSFDATGDVALRMAQEDRRVRVLRNQQNRGVSTTRNHAIAAATGEWIALLDADDSWLPERLTAMLLACGGADIVCDDLLVVKKPSGHATAIEYWSLFGWVGRKLREPHWLTLAEFIRYDLGLLKPMIRRQFLEKHGIRYDSNLRVAEDYYLYVDLLAAGARWNQLPKGYYLYWRHTDSLSLSPDAVIRQHLLSSKALLSEPAIRADPRVFAALQLHHRHSRASIARHAVSELGRQRDLLAIGHLLRANPDYASLLVCKLARHMYMRAVRRVQNPRRRVPARILDR